MGTIHSFHVHGHYSFLSLSFSLLGTAHWIQLDYFPLYVELHTTVVSTRLIPSGRTCLGMPAHHACRTYVLSLHPRFSLWSRLLPSTSTKVASHLMSCDLQSRLWMLLYSGLPIAELTRTSLTTRETEEHVEQRDMRNMRTRGTQEHEEKPKWNQCHVHTPQV